VKGKVAFVHTPPPRVWAWDPRTEHVVPFSSDKVPGRRIGKSLRGPKGTALNALPILPLGRSPRRIPIRFDFVGVQSLTEVRYKLRQNGSTRPRTSHESTVGHTISTSRAIRALSPPAPGGRCPHIGASDEGSAPLIRICHQVPVEVPPGPILDQPRAIKKYGPKLPL